MESQPLGIFLETFQQLDGDNLDLLRRIYAPTITFIDPIHTVEGIEKLMDYYAQLYLNAISLDFSFKNKMHAGNAAYVQWSLLIAHPKLKHGKIIAVPGTSYLQFGQGDLVELHRDYFDLGAMLYEQIPVLGYLVKSIKRRLGT